MHSGQDSQARGVDFAPLVVPQALPLFGIPPGIPPEGKGTRF